MRSLEPPPDDEVCDNCGLPERYPGDARYECQCTHGQCADCGRITARVRGIFDETYQCEICFRAELRRQEEGDPMGNTTLSIRELAEALRQAARLATWEADVLEDYHRYAQQYGAPGDNVFAVVLRDALASRSQTIEKFRAAAGGGAQPR